MGHPTECKRLLERERCRTCGNLTEHAKVLNGYCPMCFVKEGLTIKREYDEAPNEKPPWGRDMGD